MGTRKPTSLRGTMVPNAVLNEHAVRDIRSRIADGQMQRDIAKIYGVSQHAIHCVKTKKQWKWVE